MVTAVCLYLASHTGSWAVMIAAAIAFSFVNNTIFSLMHEAVHGVLHRNATINDAVRALHLGASDFIGTPQ